LTAQNPLENSLPIFHDQRNQVMESAWRQTDLGRLETSAAFSRGPQTPRVWIVGDEAARRRLSCFAEEAGFSAKACGSAVALAGRYDGGPGCAVLVAASPQETADVCRALERLGWTIPVVAATGDCRPACVVRHVRAGAYSVLDLGSSVQEFAAAVREAFGEDRVRREQGSAREALRQSIGELTSGELAVMRCVIAGDANKTIARKQRVSLRTVEFRRQRIYQKLGVESVAQLVTLAWKADDWRLTAPPTPTGDFTAPGSVAPPTAAAPAFA
jgi:FixJ family two-component response regulator